MPEKKMEEECRGMLVGGLITLGIGVFFLLVNLGILSSVREYWPLFPIVVGTALIIGAFFKSREPEKSQQSEH